MSLIYIVEDDTNILEIEEFALTSSGYEVRGFGNANDFYEALKEDRPSLVLLDVMLPDEDGLEILEKLRKSRETVMIPVIMVTAKTTEIDKVRGLDMGADDYISKPFGVLELIARVKALLRRSSDVLDTSYYEFEDIVLDDKKHEVQTAEGKVELTFKEYQLLKMLMQYQGMVVKRSHLMDEIWGTDFTGESRTLDMHIRTLRKKLGDSGRFIQTVRNVGYALNHTDEA
ncbi:MAG TPA: DNA-binding response regulator [Lachnospiraceae bacterium]|jgi:two-component system alkaline phosphatase synthesis response regulator PhoP|uniref:response regulator transcription factor n=1 Tax=Clostridium sp. (strain SY8519) TaxID=1042156 RepID=UPI0002171C76|nr:response regulator transcription factor [Clostridium sp. SY8519]BAK47647.1 hypothetical protein CXIVA_16810 [Clostridium sp. SY8519]HAD18878.1 DNA-binding response regulator [Lachnospiraceae bacterium]